MGISFDKWGELFQLMKPYMISFKQGEITFGEYDSIFKEKLEEFYAKYSN